MLLISSDSFDKDGTYQGGVDGTVYLETENSLKSILYDIEFANGSTVFVVDQAGRIIITLIQIESMNRLPIILLCNSLCKGKVGQVKL